MTFRLHCQSASGYFNRIFGEEHDKALMSLTGEGQDYLLANAKGHWVYHMLRQRVGDGLFFGALRQLVEQYGGREMSLADLRAAFVAAAPTGAKLETFFSQWLDRPGAPVLDVEWSSESQAGTPVARVEIRQHGEPYDLRLEIAVDSGDESELHTVALSKKQESYVLRSPGPPTAVRIDPNHRLLLWDPDYGAKPGS